MNGMKQIRSMRSIRELLDMMMILETSPLVMMRFIMMLALGFRLD